MLFKKVAIIGIGLLGGSLGLAIKNYKLAEVVIGLVRREESCKEALDLGVVDQVTLDGEEALGDADFIILATPLSVMRPILGSLLPYIKRNAILTDVGSVKGALVTDLEKLCNKTCSFVGSHPMAGSDRSGMQFSDGSLFTDTVCIVTPTKKTDKQAAEKVLAFWQSLKTRIYCMDPHIHDALLSYASHMPHVVSATIVTALENSGLDVSTCLQLTGNGWKDTTRIAASSPRIWGDILIENSEEVMKALTHCKKEIEKVMHAIKQSDRDSVKEIFSRSNRIKDLEN